MAAFYILFKKPPIFGAVAYENIVMRRTYWGSCIGIVGRNTTAGMPPASFASPPHICRFKGIASSSAVFVLAQGSPALATCPLPRLANTVPGRMDELDRRFPMSPLFLFAHFWKRQQGNFRIRDGGIENGRPKRTRLNRHRLKESQSRPAPAFAHLPQIAPFMRRPFLHLNQGQLTGNAQNSKRSFLKSASPY